MRLYFPARREPLTLTLAQAGLKVDIETIERRVMQVGHSGGIEQRFDDTLRARAGQIDVPLTWQIDPLPMLNAVLSIKEEIDEPPVAAKLDLVRHNVVPHKSGRFVDAYDVVCAVDQLARTDITEWRAIAVEVSPTASSDFLEHISLSQRVGYFETHFAYLGGEASRAHNIATAASRFDGIVLLPGQIISFNAVVGPRTLENGFKRGWEIFKGEMVEGVGGGTCQVASTLHAAAYLGGLDIIERLPHSRPSGYIQMGLDSTVVDGAVDLKLRNPFSFPIVVHSAVNKGTITFELLGLQRASSVTFSRDLVAVRDFKRDVREESSVAQGRVVLKQHGIRGYSIRRTRRVRFLDGSERTDTNVDVYPATTEIYLVPPGTDADAVLASLHPETGQGDGAASSAQQGGASPDGGVPQIVTAPGAHPPAAEQASGPARLIITR